MLKTRVITALALLAVLLLVLFLQSSLAVIVVTALFFGAAAWECFRLFNGRQPLVGAAIWTALLIAFCLSSAFKQAPLLCALCSAAWVIRLAPSLATGLPPIDHFRSRLLSGIYAVAILGAGAAIVVLYLHSALYLLSALMIVWIADIGAYCAGKMFGKHKLAPSISPGKSWEGALGGWLAVLAIASATLFHSALIDTFPAKLQVSWGWPGFVAVMTLLVAASIAGDLFESQLKRRAGMKDSSNLLPGHGGVLDRIDALIPVLPMVVLFDSWM